MDPAVHARMVQLGIGHASGAALIASEITPTPRVRQVPTAAAADAGPIPSGFVAPEPTTGVEVAEALGLPNSRVELLLHCMQVVNYPKYRQPQEVQRLTTRKVPDVRVRIAEDVAPELVERFVDAKGHGLIPEHPRSTTTLPWSGRPEGPPLLARYTASRSMTFFGSDGTLYSVKMPTNVISEEVSDAEGTKADLTKSVIGSVDRSAYMRAVDVELGIDRSAFVIPDVLSVADLDSGNGCVVRSYAVLQQFLSEGYWAVPLMSWPYLGPQLAELQGRDFSQEAETLLDLTGAAHGKFLARYGMYWTTPNAQNSMVLSSPDWSAPVGIGQIDTNDTEVASLWHDKSDDYRTIIELSGRIWPGPQPDRDNLSFETLKYCLGHWQSILGDRYQEPWLGRIKEAAIAEVGRTLGVEVPAGADDPELWQMISDHGERFADHHQALARRAPGVPPVASAVKPSGAKVKGRRRRKIMGVAAPKTDPVVPQDMGLSLVKSEPVGGGIFGEVYQVRDRSGALWALKVIRERIAYHDLSEAERRDVTSNQLTCLQTTKDWSIEYGGIPVRSLRRVQRPEPSEPLLAELGVPADCAVLTEWIDATPIKALPGDLQEKAEFLASAASGRSFGLSFLEDPNPAGFLFLHDGHELTEAIWFDPHLPITWAEYEAWGIGPYVEELKAAGEFD